MLPSILPGDEILVRREPFAHFSVGDIALFARDQRLFAHRVTSTASQLITRGDSLTYTDGPVRPYELLGRVTLIIRGSRCFRPRPTFFNRLTSFLLRRSDLLARSVLCLLARFGRVRKSSVCPS